jgi:hypothetical protein
MALFTLFTDYMTFHVHAFFVQRRIGRLSVRLRVSFVFVCVCVCVCVCVWRGGGRFYEIVSSWNVESRIECWCIGKDLESKRRDLIDVLFRNLVNGFKENHGSPQPEAV